MANNSTFYFPTQSSSSSSSSSSSDLCMIVSAPNLFHSLSSKFCYSISSNESQSIDKNLNYEKRFYIPSKDSSTISLSSSSIKSCVTIDHPKFTTIPKTISILDPDLDTISINNLSNSSSIVSPSPFYMQSNKFEQR